MGEVADGVVTCHARTAFQGVHVAADSVKAAQLVAVFIPALSFFLAVGEERHGLVNEGFRQHGVGVRIFDQFAAKRVATVRQGGWFAAAFATTHFASCVEQGVNGLYRVFFVGIFFEVFNQARALPQDGGTIQADRGAFLFVGEQQLFNGIKQTPNPRRSDFAVDTVFDVIHRIDQVVDDFRRFIFIGELRKGIELVHRTQETGAVIGRAAFARFTPLNSTIQSGMLCQRGKFTIETFGRAHTARRGNLHHGSRCSRDGGAAFTLTVDGGGSHAAQQHRQFVFFRQGLDIARHTGGVNKVACSLVGISGRIDFGIRRTVAVSSNIEEIGGNVSAVVMRINCGINEGVGRLCSRGAFCGHIDEVVVHVFAGSGFDDRRVDGGGCIGAVLRQHRFDHHFTARLSATGQSGCGEDFCQLCAVNAVGG